LQIIEPQAVGQQAMRRLVRKDRQSKLPRTDYGNGEHKGERGWPPYEHRHRAKYHPPGAENHPPAAQVGLALEGDQFVGSENVAGGEHAILQSSSGGSIRAVRECNSKWRTMQILVMNRTTP